MANEFLEFATAGGANVMSQVSWAALAERSSGFASGEADSLACNKAWRQAVWASVILGNIISADGQDALDNGDEADFKAKLLTALTNAINPRMPAGTVITFAGAGMPPGRWLNCYGDVVLRAGLYAGLFAVIGTTYNTGGEDGTQFRLPDLRGVFVRGQDAGRGLDPSRVLGSYQLDQFKEHSHTIALYEPDDNGGVFVASDDGGDPTGSTLTGATGMAGANSETRPKNVAMRFLIAY